MQGPHRPLNALTAIAIFALSSPAIAQNIDFRVENITLEQTVSTGQALNPNVFSNSDASTPTGSTSVILQRGDNNQASSGVFNSQDAATATLQIGDQNTAVAAIIDSPGSTIAQVQIGTNNTSLIGIVGGSDNTAATAQIGSNQTARIGLQNSTGTTVTFGQAGRNHNGGIVIKNAPRGTRIRVD
ncbi:MAG: hypothetical protein AAGK28_05475 [Pseudomonadota bacterium]